MRKAINYICFQTTVDGSAANSHVYGIVRGLEERGWSVNLIRVRYPETNGKPSVLKRVMEMSRATLQCLCSMRKADALYIRTHFMTFLCALAAKMGKVPVVQEINGPYEDNFIAWPGLARMKSAVIWMVRKQLSWATQIITVTPQLKQWLEDSVGVGGVSVVPNGADHQLFRPIRTKALELPENYVVFFGALARWQGIRTLLQAASRSEWPADLRLVVAGDGVERDEVVRAAAESDRILYLGQVSHRELPEIISRSEAAIIPKNNLGDRQKTGLSPIKLYEALACGVPVIVSDFPGQADFVREYRCGLVFPQGDVAALTRTIQDLHRSREWRKALGERGRRAIVDHHSWQARAADTEKILLAALSTR